MSKLKRNDINNLMTYFQIGWVHLELKILDDYISDQENKFEKQLDNAEERYRKFEKELKAGSVDNSNRYHDYIWDDIHEEIWKIESNYKQFFRQSQIIQLYSFLEHKLRYGCDTYAQLKKTAYSVRDLKGNNDLDKIKKFMVKSMGIEMNQLDPEWSFFQDLRKLRNIIVHNNAELNDKNRNYSTLNKFQKDRFKLNERKHHKSIDIRPKWFDIKLTEKSFLIEITNKMEKLLVNIGNQEVI